MRVPVPASRPSIKVRRAAHASRCHSGSQSGARRIACGASGESAPIFERHDVGGTSVSRYLSNAFRSVRTAWCVAGAVQHRFDAVDQEHMRASRLECVRSRCLAAQNLLELGVRHDVHGRLRSKGTSLLSNESVILRMQVIHRDCATACTALSFESTSGNSPLGTRGATTRRRIVLGRA